MRSSVKMVLGALLFSVIPGVAMAAPQPISQDDASMVTELTRAADSTPVVSDKGSGMRINSALGAYPSRKGVILVTSDAFKGLIPTGHAAIVYSGSQVVESVIGGVSWGANHWYRDKNQAYGVTVRQTTSSQDAQAAEWASKQIGKPYNFNYLNRDTRSRFYCSQLVWAAYKDNFGIDLDTWRWGVAIHPMELVQTDKALLLWRKS